MSDMNEEFKTFFENYEISNFGNMRRKLKNGTYKDIKGSIGTTGYRWHSLKREGKRIFFKFHQQVAFQFIGEREGNKVIDHIDRNRLNNHVSNLRYVSHKENSRNSPIFREDVKEEDNKERHRIFSREYLIRTGKNKFLIARKGEGNIKKTGDKFIARIIIGNKQFNKTVETYEEGKEFLENIKNKDFQATHENNPRKGYIGLRNKKYRARITINGNRYDKTLPTREEAEEFIKQMKELHL